MTAVTENKQTNTQTNKKKQPPPPPSPKSPVHPHTKKKTLSIYHPPPPPSPHPTTAHSCFLLGVSHLSVHKRDTCPDGASPWIVVLLCPWSLLQVRRLTCACALASHMSLQQATIVVCALVLFLAGSSSHIVPHWGLWLSHFPQHVGQGTGKHLHSLCSTHTPHHTLTLPPSCPRSLGTSWVLFQKASCML